jgi:hypothetical protein
MPKTPVWRSLGLLDYQEPDAASGRSRRTEAIETNLTELIRLRSISEIGLLSATVQSRQPASTLRRLLDIPAR